MMWLVLVVVILGAGLILAARLRSRPTNAVTAVIDDDPAMRGCPKCGNRIAVDWAFCPFCARVLAGDDSAAQSGERNLPVAGIGSA